MLRRHVQHFMHRALIVFAVVAAVAPTSLHAQTSKQAINRPGAKPGFLSPAVKTGDLVYLSGVLGTDLVTGKLAEGGIGPQTKQALENAKSALALAGGQMADVVKCTVFLTDVKDFGGMNDVYRTFFPTDPPARTTVAVAGLVLQGALLEIECIAALRK